MQQSIYVEGFAHGNPIPAGCRIGNVLMTGVISGKDARTGKRPETLDGQCAAMFQHVREIVEAAHMTTDNIIKMTVWLKDQSDRKALNAEWTKMFPDADHRPARMVLPHLGEGDALILCDFTAVA
jgi:2-iminobutanoate/2-iminopropanoate deaminase